MDPVCEPSLNPASQGFQASLITSFITPCVYEKKRESWHQIHITFSFRGNGWQGENDCNILSRMGASEEEGD